MRSATRSTRTIVSFSAMPASRGSTFLSATDAARSWPGSSARPMPAACSSPISGSMPNCACAALVANCWRVLSDARSNSAALGAARHILISVAPGVGVFGRAQVRCSFPIGRRLTPASDLSRLLSLLSGSVRLISRSTLSNSGLRSHADGREPPPSATAAPSERQKQLESGRENSDNAVADW